MSDKYTDEYIARIQKVQDYIDQNYGKYDCRRIGGRKVRCNEIRRSINAEL